MTSPELPGFEGGVHQKDALDVNFREDDSHTRERTLDNNLSWLRRFAVILLSRRPRWADGRSPPAVTGRGNPRSPRSG